MKYEYAEILKIGIKQNLSFANITAITAAINKHTPMHTAHKNSCIDIHIKYRNWQGDVIKANNYPVSSSCNE